ncbi:MAG TPA: aliphatic sulfonate ABC transporter substrate-binding protein [Sphingobium sp.]
MESDISRRSAIVAGAMTILLAACSRGSGSGANSVLRVGDQRGSIKSLLDTAGLLKDVPYPIEWAQFPVGAPLIEAMKAGAIDFGYVGSSTLTFGLAANVPLKAVSTWRFGGPGSALLVPPNSPIRTLADLKGRRIALVRGSPGHLLVAETLRSANIPFSAVTIINMNPADAKAALNARSIDAWAIWDPYFAIGQQQDHLHPIITSEHFGGEVETGAATPSAIADKRPQILDFITRVDRGFQWAAAHPEPFAAAFAADTGLSPEIAHIVKSRMKVTVEPIITDASIARHQHVADIYADIGLIPHRLDISKVYDRSFVIPAR